MRVRMSSQGRPKGEAAAKRAARSEVLFECGSFTVNWNEKP